MIVLWGASGDPPFDAVLAAVQKHRRAATVVDQRQPMEAQMELAVDGELGGWLKAGKKKVELGEVSAVYVRPYGPLDPPEVQRAGRASPVWGHALALHDTLRAFTELALGRVIHPLSVMGSNGSKPYQARTIREAGFAIPDTLLTTDPQAAREFRARHGRVIYKSVSGARSVVAELTDDKLDRLDDVRRCPVQFQAFVEGVDHRVHVVGDEVFACMLEHDAVDYRLPAAGVTKHAVELEPEVVERCLALTHALGLEVAGVDLRQTPAGAWVCFEVNPSPAFTYYETTPGRIADRIAKLLGERRPS